MRHSRDIYIFIKVCNSHMHERAEWSLWENNAYSKRQTFIFVNSSKNWGSRDAFKKTLRIYSSPQKCSQMLWETNALRRCNDVKQYAKLHFLNYCPVWIFKSSFSNPVFLTTAQKIWLIYTESHMFSASSQWSKKICSTSDTLSSIIFFFSFCLLFNKSDSIILQRSHFISSHNK